MNVEPQETAEIAKTGGPDSESGFLCGHRVHSRLDHIPIRTTVLKSFRKLRKFSERGIYSAQPPSGAGAPEYFAAFYAVRRVRRTEVRAPFQFAAPPSTFCEKKVDQRRAGVSPASTDVARNPRFVRESRQAGRAVLRSLAASSFVSICGLTLFSDTR